MVYFWSFLPHFTHLLVVLRHNKRHALCVPFIVAFWFREDLPPLRREPAGAGQSPKKQGISGASDPAAGKTAPPFFTSAVQGYVIDQAMRRLETMFLTGVWPQLSFALQSPDKRFELERRGPARASKKKRLTIVFSKRRSQSASKQSRASAGDSSRHATRVGAEPFKSLLLRQEKPQLNFQLRFFSYIRLSASSIASQWYYFVVILPSAVKSYIGEYNITVSVANNITFAKQKYHSALAEYHLIRFNLRTTPSAKKQDRPRVCLVFLCE